MAYALILSRSRSHPVRDPFGMFGRQRLAVSLLVFAAVIFRSEVAILLFTISGYLLVGPFTHLEVLIPPFLISSAMALLISIPLDSYFWQRPIWPSSTASTTTPCSVPARPGASRRGTTTSPRPCRVCCSTPSST